ncbi:MAG: hypothetical protein PT977_00105 [Acidobacteriota bacterium]|nr:hypothetical protein [Acidobacteriota bacterium]
MNVKWLFKRKKPAPQAIPKDIPRDDDRRGPVPPPPRTAHAPGVTIHKFAQIPAQHSLRRSEGPGGFFLEGEEGKARAAVLLVLEAGGEFGAGPGDVLLVSPSSSFEEISRTSPPPGHHIRRDGVAGAAFPGITGLRVLARLPEAGLAVLRLGPPPGARWVFRGIRAFAVFSGRLAAFDGDDVREIRAGSLARVADPSATLYLEAGNDAALAVALAADDFIAALG